MQLRNWAAPDARLDLLNRFPSPSGRLRPDAFSLEFPSKRQTESTMKAHAIVAALATAIAGPFDPTETSIILSEAEGPAFAFATSSAGLNLIPLT